MDIILCATSDLSYDQRMQRIAGSLAQAGYQVSLVGRSKPSSPQLAEQLYHQHRFRMWFHRGKFFYLEYNFRLLLYLLFHRSKAIGAVDLDTLLPCYLASRWPKRSLIYDAHEYYTETPEVVRRPAIQKVWARLASWLIPKVDAAYTVGPALAEIMGKRYKTTFGVVRNVPLQKEPTQVEKPEPPVILYQGVLNEGRGLEAVIEAMPYIPDAQLWLAGEGDLSEALRQQAGKSPAVDRIRFLGYVLPNKLKEVTLQATLGLNLLENRGQSYYYSLANKVFDYTQAGVPCVTMDFPEYRALREELGLFLLVEDLSVDKLAEGINTLLLDGRALDLAREACERARQVLHWEREEKRLLDIWGNILVI